MVEQIVKAWDKSNSKLKEWLKQTNQTEYQTYGTLLKKTLEFMFCKDDYEMPSHERITEIDSGDYQGTLVFVIAGYGYQPNIDQHWYTSVGYGSCSGCDTLQSIRGYDDGKTPTDEQVQEYWTLCLHMIQKMKRMSDNE